MAHILVVEDDPSNQIVIRKALVKIGGFQVTITEAVPEVLRLAQSGEVDLIVMDVSLSNSVYEGAHLDGVAITKLLKSRPAARPVLVLLATAYAMQGDAERLREACGADDYISKPFVEPRELVEKVRAMLATRASATAPSA
jgi:CheY-like chemotaxis protein